MEGTIEWLNTNQGFVLGVLTLVYVFTTVIMAGLMMHSNRMMRGFEEERTRPSVIFSINAKDHLIHAMVKNYGLSPALDVEIECEPKLTVHGEAESAIIQYKTSFLAPNQDITDVIDTGPNFFQRHTEPVFSGTVKYRGKNGKKYREEFHIDLKVFAKRGYVMEAKIGDEIKKIREILQKQL